MAAIAPMTLENNILTLLNAEPRISQHEETNYLYIACLLNASSNPTPLGRPIESSQPNKLFISPYTSAGYLKNIRKPQSDGDFRFVRPEMIFSIIPHEKPMTLP
jgi:hypothetical protein